MTQLTKNFRKYRVIFKDKREPVNITEEQYNELRVAKEDKKFNEPITIRDADTKKILFDGEIGKIEEFQERESLKSNYNAICEYGNRHPLINGKINCDCYQNYGYYGFELKIYVCQKYGIIYPQDITPEHRKEFYLHKKQQETIKN